MIVYLLLGSNIEPRLDYFNKAKSFLAEKVGAILQTSALYRTAAWGNENQADFLNQAVKIETTLEPIQLLETIKDIETLTGRKQREHWGAREIDIDILLIESQIFKIPSLEIPHPQLHKRRFALTPLAEIAGDVIHPIFNKTIAELLRECEDDKAVG
jgi:2-amino-4-hydroxy-6-hydroxymethyldihydropteridine diphosphokinase